MKVFNCPQCGATLEFERIDKPLVKCQYCDSLVVVPAELRPQPLPPSSPPLIDSLLRPPREETPPFSFGDSEATPKKVALAAVALLAVAGGVGLLIATNRASNSNFRVGTNTTNAQRLVPTPTPAPRPDGYEVAYTLGGDGTGPGLFKDEMTVAVDAGGHVYASDETRRVQRFDASGRFLNTWNIPAQTKWYGKLRGGARKLLTGERGEVYAVLAGVILKLDGETGEALGAAHGSDYIHDAALVPGGGGGLLVVSQKGDDDELVLIGGDGRAARRTHRFVSSLLDKRLEVEALRVAAGAGGEAYALYAIGGVSGEHWYDDEDIAVFRFSPESKYLSRFGGQGREPGQYGPPTALAADARGRVYVCESFDKVHVYEPDGRYVRTLKVPHAVEALAFDAQDNLYVAGGHRVSKLLLDR
jgi:DNA-directed RNA polymerase subunit RPC12/RpoP